MITVLCPRNKVPIYAIESWLSLRFKNQALWFESGRDWCVVPLWSVIFEQV